MTTALTSAAPTGPSPTATGPVKPGRRRRRRRRAAAWAANHPIGVAFATLGVCLVLRLVDIYVLRLDERWGEIFVSKSLGFVLVLVAAVAVWGRVAAIGLHRRRVLRNLLLGAGVSLVLYTLAYAGELSALAGMGNHPGMLIAGIDAKQGVTGGVWFAVWLLAGNVVNALMEEGLFRGVFLPALTTRFSFWRANLLQALLFGLWHAVWPIKAVLSGDQSVMGGVMSGLMLFIGSFISGLFWGYLHHRTGSLWTAVAAHFVANSVQNLVHTTTGGVDQAAWLRGTIVGVLTTALLVALVLRDRRRHKPSHEASKVQS